MRNRAGIVTFVLLLSVWSHRAGAQSVPPPSAEVMAALNEEAARGDLPYVAGPRGGELRLSERFVLLREYRPPDLPRDFLFVPTDRPGVLRQQPATRVVVTNKTGRLLRVGLFRPASQFALAADIGPGQSWSSTVEDVPAGDYYLGFTTEWWGAYTRQRLSEAGADFIVIGEDPSLPTNSSTATPRPPSRPTAPPSQAGPQPPERPASLPPAQLSLTGRNEIRVTNPNAYGVQVQIRTGSMASNFEVLPRGTAATRGPSGHYQIFFIYSNEPEALYQGDDFDLSDGEGIEIQLVRQVGGNYGVRRVR